MRQDLVDSLLESSCDDPCLTEMYSREPPT